MLNTKALSLNIKTEQPSQPPPVFYNFTLNLAANRSRNAGGIHNRGEIQKETRTGNPKAIAIKILIKINSPIYSQGHHENLTFL